MKNILLAAACTLASITQLSAQTELFPEEEAYFGEEEWEVELEIEPKSKEEMVPFSYNPNRSQRLMNAAFLGDLEAIKAGEAAGTPIDTATS